MSTNVPILGATVTFDANLVPFNAAVDNVRAAITGLTGSGAKIIPIDAASVENAKAAASAIAKITPALDEAEAAAEKMQKIMDKMRFKLDLEGFKGAELEKALGQIEEAENKLAGTAGATAAKIISVSKQQQAAYLAESIEIEKVAEAQRVLQAEEQARLDRVKATQEAVTRMLQREKEQREANAAAAKAMSGNRTGTVDTSIAAAETKQATEVLGRAQKQAAQFKEAIRGAHEELSALRKKAEDAGVSSKSSFLEAEKAIQKVEKEYQKLVSSTDKNRGKVAQAIADGFDTVASKLIKTEEKIDGLIEKSKKVAAPTATAAAADTSGALDAVIGKWIGISQAVRLANMAIDAFKDATKRAFEVYRASAKFGINVQELQSLSLAAEEVGLKFSELGNGLRYMETNIGKAQSGVKMSVDNLSILGLTAEDLKGKLPQEQLAVLADRFVGLEDPARRSEVAMAIFGRQGANMIPLLALGGETLRELSNRSKELGSDLSEKTLKSLRDSEKATIQLNIAFGNLMSNLAAGVAGPVTDATQAITEWAAASTKAFDAYNKFGKVEDINGALFITIDNVKVATSAFMDLTKVLNMHILEEYLDSGAIKSNTLETLRNIGALYDQTDAIAAAEARTKAKAAAVAAATKTEAVANQSLQEILTKGVEAEQAAEKEREKFRDRKDQGTAKGQMEKRLAEIYAERKVAIAAAEEAANRQGQLAREKGAAEWKVNQIIQDRLAKEIASVNVKTMEKAAAAELFRHEREGIEAKEKSQAGLKKLEDDAASGRLASAKETLKQVEAAGIAQDIVAAKALVEAAGRKDSGDELLKAEKNLARITGSYQDQVDLLIEQHGWETASEKSKAAQIVATQMLAEDTRRLDQEEKNRSNSIAQILSSQQQALDNLGKSQAQLNVLKLQGLKASDEELAKSKKMADLLDKRTKDIKDDEKNKADAQSLIESAMTKEEKTAQKIADIRRLESMNYISKEQAQKAINNLAEKEHQIRKATVGMYSDGLSLVRAMASAGVADENDAGGGSRRGRRLGGGGGVPVPAPLPPTPPGLPGVVNSVMDRIATLNEGILAILTRWDTDGIKIKSLPPINATYA